MLDVLAQGYHLRRGGMLGENILGTGFSCDIKSVESVALAPISKVLRHG